MLDLWTNLGNSAALRKHFIESASIKYTVYRAYTGILIYYNEYTGIICKMHRCVTALRIFIASCDVALEVERCNVYVDFCSPSQASLQHSCEEVNTVADGTIICMWLASLLSSSSSSSFVFNL
jgi:hypothetical protein